MQEQIEAHKKNQVVWIDHLDFNDFKNDLERKRQLFLSQYKETSWLSFNFADEKAYAGLSEPKEVDLLKKYATVSY